MWSLDWVRRWFERFRERSSTVLKPERWFDRFQRDGPNQGTTTFKFHRYGLNDAGEMALAVQRADQRKLVVRVAPTDLPNDRCITQVPEANAWLAAPFAERE